MHTRPPSPYNRLERCKRPSKSVYLSVACLGLFTLYNVWHSRALLNYNGTLIESTKEKKHVTAAVCHKTLFGNVDLLRIKYWVEYNEKLGFDHHFIWYMPEIANYTGFTQLSDMPNVTLIPNAAASIGWDENEQDHVVVGAVDQRTLEQHCLRGVARDYDWVMHADADEFIRLSRNMTIKDILQTYDSYNYLSFGKHVYTLTDAVANVTDSGFGNLDRYPFHGGPFCLQYYNRHNKLKTDTFSQWRRTIKYFAKGRRYKPGNTVCTMWHGRSKTIVRPKFHQRVNIHGTKRRPLRVKGQIHFDTRHAYFMEWSHLFDKFEHTMMREKQDFVVDNASSVSIHDFDQAHIANKDGTFNVYYDAGLHDWLQYVASIERR